MGLNADMTADEEEFKMGSIVFEGKDILTREMKFDRLAISGRSELLLLSLIADTQSIKQVRSILAGGAKALATGSGIKVNRPGDPAWYAHSPGRMTPSTEGYQCYTHKLGYGMAHALFLTRSVGFMRVVTPESLWAELKNVRFTTPILKEWVPHIEAELRRQERLEDAHVFNCHCGILSATDAKLDEIVSQGLEQRELVIPLPVAV